MRTILIAAFLAAAPLAPAAAESLPAPRLEPGDSWTYTIGRDVRGVERTSHVQLSLTRIDPDFMAVDSRPAGSSAPGREMLVNRDWSRMRSVDGRQTIVNRPLAFPLSPGKSWVVEFTEFTPADRRHTREHIVTTFRAGPLEDVTVPAGTFHAMRIDCTGTWTADLPPNTLVTAGRAANGGNFATASRQGARTASGRILKTFWYVPEVHRWVRSEEDIYDTNGVRTSHEWSSLEAFSLAEPRTASDAAEPPADAPKAPRGHRKPRHAAKPAAPAPTSTAAPLLQEL